MSFSLVSDTLFASPGSGGIRDRLTGRPVALAAAGRLDVIARHSGTQPYGLLDFTEDYRSQTWARNNRLGNYLSELALARPATDRRLFLFGRGTDDNLWFHILADRWGEVLGDPWVEEGNPVPFSDRVRLASEPCAVATTDGLIHVFCTAMRDGDSVAIPIHGVLDTRTLERHWSAESNWALASFNPGASIRAVVVNDRGRSAVTLVARGRDSRLWRCSLAGSNFGSWTLNDEGGVFTSDPFPAAFESEIFVFVRGQPEGDLPGGLWFTILDSAGVGWNRLGGNLPSPFMSIATSPRAFDICIRGTDHAVWRFHFNPVSRTATLNPHGGRIDDQSEPCAVFFDRLLIFVRGEEQDLWADGI